MAETYVRGAIHRGSSGDRPNLTGGSPPPPPPSRPGDLIGALPDAVIHHIFSFLPLRDVVRTSVLSKRWRSTWTSTTDLVFDGWNICTKVLLPVVDSVLSQCTSSTVKRFHVTGFKYEKPHRRKVDLWLRFAAEHSVEDLCLWLSDFSHSPFYTLPGFLYRLRRLVRLEVGLCRFSLRTTVEWPCLKVLSIGHAELSDEILGRIFRGSPVLESLELLRCWGMKNIIIESTSVKDLVLRSPAFSETVKICAPHLLSLRMSGYLDDFAVFGLDGISSLVEAELDFSIQTGVADYKRTWLKELLKKLCGVPTITIGGCCLQTLSLLEMEGVPFPLSKCQNLILHGSVGKWDLPGIAYMLQSSHCLEKLVVHLNEHPLLKFELDEESQERFNFDEEEFLCLQKGNFECLGKHLKRVEIIIFEATYSLGRKYLLALIKFLLGDALVLEKLIIKAELRTRRTTVHPELLRVSRTVLSYRRASKNAEVIFNYPFG